MSEWQSQVWGDNTHCEWIGPAPGERGADFVVGSYPRPLRRRDPAVTPAVRRHPDQHRLAAVQNTDVQPQYVAPGRELTLATTVPFAWGRGGLTVRNDSTSTWSRFSRIFFMWFPLNEFRLPDGKRADA